MSGTAYNPLVQLGNLNRLRASIVVAQNPLLNITAQFLAKRGIQFSFGGNAVEYLPVMVGAVTSPEPYIAVTFTAYVVKTLSLANAYKTQWELNALLGQITIRPDSSAINPFVIHNCSLMGPGDLDFSGTDPDFQIKFGGVYYINSSLFA